MGKFTHLMIHWSATPDHLNVQRHHLEQWHIVERGWSRLGYSMLIDREAQLDILIPFDRDDQIDSWEISNGARGWNGRTKHICYSGGPGSGNGITPGQELVLEAVVKMLVMLYPDIKLIGHNQVSRKECPGFDVPEWAKGIGLSSVNIDFHCYV